MSSMDDRTVRLSDIAVRLLRHRSIVVGTTVVVVAAGAALGLTWPASYSATSVVTVSPITTTPFASTPINQQVNITTERAVVLSSEVARLAASDFGAPGDPADIPPSLSIDSPLNSQVLQITATQPDPAAAAATANGVAEAYLAFRAQGADEVADKIVDSLGERIEELRGELLDDDASAALPSQVALRQQLTDLQNEQSALEGISLNPGRVVTAATADPSPSGPGPVLFVGPALVLGLVLGVLLALLRDATDPRVRTGSRLAELLSVPVVQGDRHDDAEELARRTALRLGLVSPDLRRPVLLGVMAAEREVCVQLSDLMLEVFRSTGRHALCVRPDDLTARHADLGWPDAAQLQQWDSADVVVVGLCDAGSSVRLAMLAQRMDMVVVAAAPSSRRSAVTALVADAAEAGVRVAAAVVLPPSGRSRPARDGHASSGLAQLSAPAPARALPGDGPRRPAAPSELGGGRS
ncbi:hypothetical protein [Aquipuribacter hungaricus]|uniref:Polysaccharide chain length determinant N-terminal domain-containing protein n=2 Tax=Aquipuribacter hungaricus TaxID=545624 RepID=A0ABV7WEH1_9MICO